LPLSELVQEGQK